MINRKRYAEDSMEDSESERSPSPYRSQSPHRSRNAYSRGRSSSPHRQYPDRSHYPTVSFKSSRSSTPPAGILKSDGADLANPTLRCFKCKGYGHKADVCPSVTK